MKTILPTLKRWVSRDPRITLEIRKEDQTNHREYPDAFRTACVEMILESDGRGDRPYLHIWIPLTRRTPMFEFGGDCKPDDNGQMLYAQADVEANFPSFDNSRELLAGLDFVLGEFLARYGASGAGKKRPAKKTVPRKRRL
jgi:hypothetical protein